MIYLMYANEIALWNKQRNRREKKHWEMIERKKRDTSSHTHTDGIVCSMEENKNHNILWIRQFICVFFFCSFLCFFFLHLNFAVVVILRRRIRPRVRLKSKASSERQHHQHHHHRANTDYFRFKKCVQEQRFIVLYESSTIIITHAPTSTRAKNIA